MLANKMVATNMDLDRVHCKAGCISVINQRQNCKLNPFVIILLHYKKEEGIHFVLPPKVHLMKLATEK